ncbi:hypothetical protein D3C86_1424320 [compost metagenome]
MLYPISKSGLHLDCDFLQLKLLVFLLNEFLKRNPGKHPPSCHSLQFRNLHHNAPWLRVKQRHAEPGYRMPDNGALNNNLCLLPQFVLASIFLHELLLHLLFSLEPKFYRSYAMIPTSKSASIGLFREPGYKSGEFVHNKGLQSKLRACELSMLLLHWIPLRLWKGSKRSRIHLYTRSPREQNDARFHL